MDKINSIISIMKGDTGSVWQRILYYFIALVIVVVLILIIVLIVKLKKKNKALAATEYENGEGGESNGDKRVYIWKDRRRTAIGLPWTFDRYRLTKEKLLLVTGFFNIKEEEVKLYRVLDFSLTKTFWQRIFGIGTVVVKSNDKSLPVVTLKNIKHPNKVKELLSDYVERERLAKRVGSSEMMGLHDHQPGIDIDGDGIPDEPAFEPGPGPHM